MKKLIVALMLLAVLAVSVVACSCGGEEPVGGTKESTSVTTTERKPKEPIYDTDDSWGPLIPMK